MSAAIHVRGLCKAFRDDAGQVEVLRNITFDAPSGSVLSLFGPNGCGKSTLLRILAGIEQFSEGSVEIGDGPPAPGRAGMVFQNFSKSLLPWRNGWDNILLPTELRRQSESKESAKARIESLLQELQLELPLNHHPRQMSGGQQQVVAILRTLVYEPGVLLLDEPFSALDYLARLDLQDLLLSLWERHDYTMVVVSHDIDQAIYLADHIALLSPRPATVLETLEVTLPRPRQRAILNSQPFARLREAAIDGVYGGGLP